MAIPIQVCCIYPVKVMDKDSHTKIINFYDYGRVLFTNCQSLLTKLKRTIKITK